MPEAHDRDQIYDTDQPAMEWHPNHVLVIEDEEGHAELIRRGFKSYQQDFHLTFAGSLLDARNRINKNPPDLIIADWLLPDGKGIEILPSDREAITIPVIIMTSHGNEELAVQMMKAGVVDYIVKSESSFKDLPHIAERALRDWGNIVQRKRAEETLKKARQELRFILDSVPALVWQKDTEGRYVQVNQRYCDTVGLSEEDIVGRTDHELYPDVIADKYMQDDREVMASRTDRLGIEERHTRPSGDSGWSLADKMVWYDSERNVKGTIGFAIDITERKRAEEALRESEETFRALAENANDGILVTVAEGAHTYANKRVSEITGYSVAELLKTGIKDLASSDEFEKVTERFRKILRGEPVPPQYETTIICKDRKSVPIEVTSAKTVWRGQPADLVIIRDISERKRAEEALRESEEKFRSLVEHALEGILILDLQGTILFANNAAARTIEADDCAGLIGRNVMEFIAPESREDVARDFIQVSQGHDAYLAQYNAISAKGNKFYVESIGKVISYEGKPADLLSIRDITERKRAEEALQESEAKYRTIFENTGTAMVIVEESNIISLANKEFAQLIGFSKDDIEGKKSWTEFVVKEDLERMLAQHRLRRQNPEKALTHYEFRSVTKSGDIRTVYLSIDMIPGTTKSVASLLDITERKRAEEALHESEERYRILTDAAHDAIYTVNPEGVVTFVNSGGAALIGMPPEKIVGLSLESLYDPEIAQEFRENLDKVISTKRPVRFDAKFWQENPGQITWLDAQLVPQFGPDGSVVQVIGISRSITDRKQAEMLLKRFNVELEWQVRLRTAELEHTNTLLEAAIIQRTLAEESIRKSLNERELLLREIHHRVKNNLQIILSLISLQSRNIKDPHLLDTMGEFQNRIMAMAHVHERMCRAEDISRIDLSEIVTFLGSSLFKSYKVDRRHIRLNVEMKDLQVTIDSAIPISLIINELVSNSIKHAFPKGTSGEITIAGRREADTLVFSIRDTGIGIPKDLDWKRNKQSLGHRLVVSLVEQLNGTIELDRTTGTAFNIVVKEKQ